MKYNFNDSENVLIFELSRLRKYEMCIKYNAIMLSQKNSESLIIFKVILMNYTA